ncbi:hypothetical protein ORL82_09310 [Bacillus cereus]|uniref:hypothetical protein n=1 Tax=Bacillus cereus TaxID=1396 RepID=UPI0005E1B539|nr:hypothetical protein [Bacillus cereus]MDZ4424547.1 hypothetical protein [Bacillus cereus]CJV74649.1 Uncharacterised protein [Streptococcus pneumoniae]
MTKEWWIEDLQDVEIFINKVRTILTTTEHQFDIQATRKDEDPLDPHTTQNTLLSLDYDADDVKKELITLKASHYCKTGIDRPRPTSPPFWFFERTIKGKSVYIKFKIRDEGNKKIFCMSFHFPRWPITDKPYA